MFSVTLDRTRDECKNQLDSCTKKHVGLANCADNLTVMVFRQAYATIWSVPLVRADMGYQWISRFLANGLVCCDDIMAPFAREILAWLAESGEPIPLILEVAPVWWTVQGLADCRSVCISCS